MFFWLEKFYSRNYPRNVANIFGTVFWKFQNIDDLKTARLKTFKNVRKMDSSKSPVENWCKIWTIFSVFCYCLINRQLSMLGDLKIKWLAFFLERTSIQCHLLRQKKYFVVQSSSSSNTDRCPQVLEQTPKQLVLVGLLKKALAKGGSCYDVSTPILQQQF